MKQKEIVQVRADEYSQAMEVRLYWLDHPGEGPRGDRQAEWNSLENVDLAVYHKGQILVEVPVHGDMEIRIFEVDGAAPERADQPFGNL